MSVWQGPAAMAVGAMLVAGQGPSQTSAKPAKSREQGASKDASGDDGGSVEFRCPALRGKAPANARLLVWGPSERYSATRVDEAGGFEITSEGAGLYRVGMTDADDRYCQVELLCDVAQDVTLSWAAAGDPCRIEYGDPSTVSDDTSELRRLGHERRMARLRRLAREQRTPARVGAALSWRALQYRDELRAWADKAKAPRARVIALLELFTYPSTARGYGDAPPQPRLAAQLLDALSPDALLWRQYPHALINATSETTKSRHIGYRERAVATDKQLRIEVQKQLATDAWIRGDVETNSLMQRPTGARMP